MSHARYIESRISEERLLVANKRLWEAPLPLRSDRATTLWMERGPGLISCLRHFCAFARFFKLETAEFDTNK